MQNQDSCKYMFERISEQDIGIPKNNELCIEKKIPTHIFNYIHYDTSDKEIIISWYFKIKDKYIEDYSKLSMSVIDSSSYRRLTDLELSDVLSIMERNYNLGILTSLYELDSKETPKRIQDVDPAAPVIIIDPNPTTGFEVSKYVGDSGIEYSISDEDSIINSKFASDPKYTHLSFLQSLEIPSNIIAVLINLKKCYIFVVCDDASKGAAAWYGWNGNQIFKLVISKGEYYASIIFDEKIIKIDVCNLLKDFKLKYEFPVSRRHDIYIPMCTPSDILSNQIDLGKPTHVFIWQYFDRNQKSWVLSSSLYPDYMKWVVDTMSIKNTPEFLRKRLSEDNLRRLREILQKSEIGSPKAFTQTFNVLHESGNDKYYRELQGVARWYIHKK